MVNEVLHREKSRRQVKSLFTPNLHPNGIKEMAASKDLRVAYAVIHLLDALQEGRVEDRLNALRTVRDEVLHCAQSELRINTGRVLVQIMKELVRSQGDTRRQLELAHDFRLASAGKPFVVRRLLQRFHLLEMPEDWSQLSFDDHVHDANTKGRKFPTHLILDAWIKGIRSLTVIHYNHVSPRAASELIEAAEIMGIKVRLGVEFAARWGDGFAHLIWSPRGIVLAQEFVGFLRQHEVEEFMALGRQVSEYQACRVLEALRAFNQEGRPALEKELGLAMSPLDPAQFLEFVGLGQASILHLAQFIHNHLWPLMQAKAEEIKAALPQAAPNERAGLGAQLTRLDGLLPESIAQRYLGSVHGDGFELLQPDDPDLPELARLKPGELLDRLAKLHASARVTLNLSGLGVEDVLELVNECQGGITHLEIFNLKDYVAGKAGQMAEISRLQQALNSGNAIIIKQCIRDIMKRVEESGRPDAAQRLARLRLVLLNISQLSNMYRRVPLKSRLGSDSTGRSINSPGMGLAVLETLPRRSRKAMRGRQPSRPVLPVESLVHEQVSYLEAPATRPRQRRWLRLARRAPGLGRLGLRVRRDWHLERHLLTKGDRSKGGNLISLGGGLRSETNGFAAQGQSGRQAGKRGLGYSWSYLNTGLKNGLKVLIGFIPAALTFALSQDWWVLAWLGAPIWFAITGSRNILQSVLGGGGVRRSPLLRWNNYVSWSRLADSLLFTGFSVPLLDYLVKTLLMDRGLGVNTHTNPAALYAVMSLVNGLYICTHNILRGLPRSAAIGNLFRSILAFPLAVGFNAALGGAMGWYGLPGVDEMLQQWAAVISKAASDFVAGFIEGMADRMQNLRIRAWDYAGKLGQLFDTYARLELLFPENDVKEMLQKPKSLLQSLDPRVRDLAGVMIIHALDLLYFWMYQPRSQGMFKALLQGLSGEELGIIARSQLILRRQREISQMFVDGLVGKRFSRPLSFYLDRWSQYLATCQELINKLATQEKKRPSHFLDQSDFLDLAPAGGVSPAGCLADRL